MFNYYKRGWHGQLSFSQIFLGSGGAFMLEGGLAYIGFYILVIATVISDTSFSFSNIVGVALCLYGIIFYLWSLKAVWGSANQCSSPTIALLIRIFAVVLPFISVVLFILLIICYLISALIDSIS